MRIGLVCPYSFDVPGGVQAHILDLASYLQESGHEVGVIGPATEAAEVPEFVRRGGPSIAIPYNGSVARLSLGPRASRELREFISSGHFDVLHIHEPNAPSFSMAALRLARGPIVATYHVSASESRLLKLATPGLRPMLEKIRGGIAVSEMARRWQVEQLGGDPVLIPNGVHTDFFAQRARQRSLKPRLSIAFLGRLDEPRKGLTVLLQAVALLPENSPVDVVVMGDGTPPAGAKARFVGRVSEAEKARILGESDIFVAPNSGGESFGIVLVEAMAAGCAVVASDLEAFSDVLQVESSDPAGAVFRTGDPADLARVLAKLVGDERRRQALAAAGQRRSRDFDWSRVGAAITQVYETVRDGTEVRV